MTEHLKRMGTANLERLALLLFYSLVLAYLLPSYKIPWATGAVLVTQFTALQGARIGYMMWMTGMELLSIVCIHSDIL